METLRLIPEPKTVEWTGGRCGREALAREPQVEADGALLGEAYRLKLRSDGVRIAAGSDVGAFRARQTLAQLKAQAAADGSLPALRIEDAPAFRHRGVLIDISRGRVPRPERLKRRLAWLASMKINHVQLYFEHPFAFAFDPDISGEDAYGPDVVHDLDTFCRALHIELVPCFTCFGHLGKILSLPRYRGLAEVEFPAADWASATFLQRLHGATVNPDHPGTLPLFERLLGEFLPCFSAGSFNLCGDETYELGAHLGQPSSAALGELYARHVRNIAALAEAHGKAVMLWGDMLRKHPEAIGRLPAGATVLDWAYFPSNDFTRCRQFAEAGVPFWTCPSTRGFGALFNRVPEAAEVIRRQAEVAVAFGGEGLLNTDWGDFGHFNLPAASLHPLALGAALAWNPKTTDADFDAAFSRFVHPAEWAREAGALPMRATVSPFASVHPRLPEEAKEPLPKDVAEATAQAARCLAAAFDGAAPTDAFDETDARQLALAIRMIEFAARCDGGRWTGAEAVEQLDVLEKAYVPLWFEESLPRGVLDVHAWIFAPLRGRLLAQMDGAK